MRISTLSLVAAGSIVLSGAPVAAMEERDADVHGLVAQLQSRCFECHSVDKAKGGLALDSAAGWLESVDGVDPEDSELYYRITLDATDPDAMPPEGPRLDADAKALLRRWIEAGAPEEPLAEALARAAKEASSRSARLDDVRRRSGARIDERPASDAAQPATLLVSWSHEPTLPSKAKIEALAPVADRIIELSLAGLEGPVDEWLSALPELPALRRVHLERTGVTTAGVARLIERTRTLSYLNLHSTRVTADVREIPELRSTQLILFGTAAAEPTEDETDPFATLQRFYPRRILAADASKNRVALLMETAIGKPTVLWERPTVALHDLQWLGDTEGGHGRVLVQETWQRIVEVDTGSNEVLWTYDAAPASDERVEIHSFRRLPDGTTMVAESGRARVIFVDRAGQITGSFPLQVERPDAHRDTRLVRPTSEGTFLVAHEGEGSVREYTRAGEVIWSYAVPLFEGVRAPGHGFDAYGNQAFGALRLRDGSTLISTGNGHSFLRVNRAGDVLWRLGQDDLEGVRFAWTTTVQELSNGHLVLGNCHAGPSQPQAIELDTEGRVVWKFRDFERFGDNLSNLLVIERTREL